jgi:hypothetical protein
VFFILKGSNGKVVFEVKWSPNIGKCFTYLESLYHKEPREPKKGEIGGRAVVAGLKAFSPMIKLQNASRLRLGNGKFFTTVSNHRLKLSK